MPICKAFVMYFSVLCLFNCSLSSDLPGWSLELGCWQQLLFEKKGSLRKWKSQAQLVGSFLRQEHMTKSNTAHFKVHALLTARFQ